jgi:hypothetical protein
MNYYKYRTAGVPPAFIKANKKMQARRLRYLASPSTQHRLHISGIESLLQ